MHRRCFLTLTTGLVTAPALLRAAEDENLKLRALYSKDGGFSDLARELEGKSITVEGYMAPPLKADSTFFVLTKIPMSVCPFCETEAEWPDDILAVYTRRVYKVAPFNRRINVSGTLSLGSYRDPDTGFLSLVRIEQARYSYA
jgi:hypothetical protein